METAEILVAVILLTTIIVDALLFAFIVRGQKPGIIWSLLLIHLGSIMGWSTSIFMLLRTGQHPWAYCSFAFPIILALSKYLFVLGFPEGKLSAPHLPYLFPLGAVLIILSFTHGALFTSFTVVDGYYIQAENGPFAFVYALYIAYLLIYPIVVLINKYMRGIYDAHIKAQLKYLSIGTALFFVIGLLTNSVLPVFFDIYFFNGLGPSFSLVLAGLIIFIISRHHFLDVRTALQRSFVFTLLLLLVTLLYMSVLHAVGIIVQHLTEMAIVLSAGITTVISVFTIPKLDAYLRKKTDRLFFKHRYNYAESLLALSETVNSMVEADAIRTYTEQSLKSIFHAACVTVETRQIEPEVSSPEVLTVPIIVDSRQIGTIILGEKNSGDPYTAEDHALVTTFSHQIAGAFERARLYEEVVEYSRELEARVEERTAKLRELQERQSHMMLDLAHKLQNPLTLLKSEVGLIRREHKTHDLDFFEKTIDDTSVFIYDLLNLARMETASEDIEMERCDLSTLTEELTEYFAVIAKDRNIRFSAHIEPGIVLLGNRKKLTELLTNLVSNAMKYLKPDRDTNEISVSLMRTESGATLEVRDTGMGIDASELPHIFDRFYRAHDTKGIDGTGLGLAIVKKIVELHRGTISVSSQKGEGTTFTIHFPLKAV